MVLAKSSQSRIARMRGIPLFQRVSLLQCFASRCEPPAPFGRPYGHHGLGETSGKTPQSSDRAHLPSNRTKGLPTWPACEERYNRFDFAFFLIFFLEAIEAIEVIDVIDVIGFLSLLSFLSHLSYLSPLYHLSLLSCVGKDLAVL